MKLFLKNSCRFCKKVYCCEDCRLQHEINNHKLHSACDFCNYGTLNINAKLSETLRKHINEIHFPFNCPFCLNEMKYIDELRLHLKTTCNKLTPHKKEINNNSKLITPTPAKKSNLEEFKDKINITTSTPMNKNDHNVLECLPETITPVNIANPESSKLKNRGGCIKSRSTLCNTTKISDSSMKRRVTFCDTIEDVIEYEIEKIEDDQLHSIKYAEEVNETIWQTAIEELKNNNTFEENNTFLESSKSELNECENSKAPRNDNSSCNELHITPKINTSEPHKKSGFWTSMTCLVKSVIDGLSVNENYYDQVNQTNKRSKPDEEDIFPTHQTYKRRRYSSLQCRRTIRPIPKEYERLYKKVTCDKAAQTD